MSALPDVPSLPEGWNRSGFVILDAGDVPVLTVGMGGRGDPPDWRENAARLAEHAPETLAALLDLLRQLEAVGIVEGGKRIEFLPRSTFSLLTVSKSAMLVAPRAERAHSLVIGLPSV